MSGNLPNRDQFPDPGELCVLVAGKPGNGKSTALNNVFDVQLETGVTSGSVTKKIEVTKVRKNGIALTVVDTPGLGALDIKKEVVTNEIAEVLNGRPYTLLYCLSVSPDCRLTELDETIATNLQATLGKEVWDRCVLLLTFSDTARSADDFKLNAGLYKKYIKGVAVEFGSILSKIGSTDIRVCTVFDYDSNTIFIRAESGREVMAIPVGKSVSGVGVDKMLPDVIGSDECWTDLVFVEIMRMTNESHRMSFVALKYGVEATDCGASSVIVPGTSRSSSVADEGGATGGGMVTGGGGVTSEGMITDNSDGCLASPLQEISSSLNCCAITWGEGKSFRALWDTIKRFRGLTPALLEDST